MSKIATIFSIHDIDFNAVKKEIDENLVNLTAALEGIKALKEFNQDLPITSLKIENVIMGEYKKFELKYYEVKKQSECEHNGVRFHESVGHTHGGEHKKTYCTECGYIFDSYVD
jgi:hypothetical protein